MEENKNLTDILDRQQFVEQLKNLINTLNCEQTNRSFAINGTWGCGKSFVLDMLKGEFSNCNDNDTIIIQFNAWEYDFYEEPLVAILSCIVDKLNDILKNKNFISNSLKTCLINLSEIFGSITKYITGVNVVNESKKIVNKVKELKNIGEIKNNFDNNQVLKNTILLIQKNLGHMNKKIIFIVDEIDRCLPSYAIKVFERIHHVFNNLKNSITIYSLDKNQLKQLISNYYGSSLNVDKYLEKFIEFSLELPKGSFNQNFFKLFQSYLSNFTFEDSLNNDFLEFTKHLMENIDIRKRIQIIKKAELLHSITINKKCDISIAYFELFSLVIFDYYKKELGYLLISCITPKKLCKEGDLKECFSHIFNNVKINETVIKTKPKDVPMVFNNYDYEIEIHGLNDIYSLLFLYLRKISKYDIQYSLSEVNDSKKSLSDDQLKNNIEIIKTFYNNIYLIH